MVAQRPISPTHRSIHRYYEQVAAVRGRRVLKEMSVRSAFEPLLADTAKLKGWTFIHELPGMPGAAPSSALTAPCVVATDCRVASPSL